MNRAGRAAKAAELLKKGDYGRLLTLGARTLFPTGNPILYWGSFYLCRLEKLKDLPLSLDLEAGPARAGDVERIKLLHPDRAYAVDDCLADGQTLIVVRDGARLAASVWAAAGKRRFMTDKGWLFQPEQPGGLWCHNAEVEPDYRMKGAFLALMRGLRDHAERVGAKGLYGVIDCWNQASVRPHRATGWELLRRIDYVSVLGLKAFRVSGADRAARPRVDLAYRLMMPDRHLV